ncbi:helix-turn-helix domain-containing protein [Chloroflexota bacterium]
MYRLRSKLEPDSSKPQMLITERGVGYKFKRIA